MRSKRTRVRKSKVCQVLLPTANGNLEVLKKDKTNQSAVNKFRVNLICKSRPLQFQDSNKSKVIGIS